jgi:SAM-dependent methyltransferase
VIIKHIVEHLPQPAKAIAEIGRVTEPGGVLILATPNLDSLLKPWKGDRWIGYQDPTHISLKRPSEWLDLIRGAGFRPLRVFADGFWDVPYIPAVPGGLQKLFFGSLGGFQAITGLVFLPMRWGESVIVIARRNGRPPAAV